jgi:spore maturation protein SpmB
MGGMIMNMAANMLGLGNAATPFGLKAMHELNKLNPHPGIATNPMALFLAINTSGIAVLPLGAVAMRQAQGSADAAGIIVPSILATSINTVFAVIAVKLLERSGLFAAERYVTATPGTEGEAKPAEAPKVSASAQAEAEAASVTREPTRGWRLVVVLAVWIAILAAMVMSFQRLSATAAPLDVLRGMMSGWILPLLMLAIVSLGFGRKLRVYEVFVQNAKEGFQIAVTIIPFLVAILVATGMFRASGAMDFLVQGLGRVLQPIGFPPEALPMALMRPLSGSGALGIMVDTMKAYGPDSFVGYLVSVMNGASETTFYTLALYFGSIQIRATRHTVVACVFADFVGVVASVIVCRLFFL